MICDADALKRVMISNVTNYVRPNYVRLLFEDFMGQGLLMAEGKVHDKQRKIFSAAFHFQNLSALSPNFSSQADKLVDSWFRKMPADSALVVDLIKEVHNLAMDIIGMVGFGYDFDSCNGRETEFGDAYSTVHSSAAITLSNTIQSLWPFKLLPTPGLLRKRRALHKLRSVVARIVAKGREEQAAAAAAAAAGSAAAADCNLLGLMLRACDAAGGGGMTDAELNDNILTFLAAGHETTASGICWTLCACPGPACATPRRLVSACLPRRPARPPARRARPPA